MTIADAREIWKPIKKYERIYEVSDCGRIRRLETFVKNKRWGNNDIRLQKGRILKPQLIKCNGYLRVYLSKNGHPVGKYIASLVLKAFRGSRPKGKVINHIDFIRTNNNIKNLEYLTQKENANHSSVGGRISKKLNKNDVREIRRKYSTGNFFQYELAKKYKVSKSMISAITTRTWWRNA